MAFKMGGWSAFTKDKKYIRNKAGKIVRVEEVPSFGEEGYEETDLDKYYPEDEDPEGLFVGSGGSSKKK